MFEITTKRIRELNLLRRPTLCFGDLWRCNKIGPPQTEPQSVHVGMQQVAKKLKDYLSENELSNIRALKRKTAQWINNSMQLVSTYTLKPNRKKQRSKLKM